MCAALRAAPAVLMGRHRACCRFSRHRDWVFPEAGVGWCEEGDLGEFKIEAAHSDQGARDESRASVSDLDVHDTL